MEQQEEQIPPNSIEEQIRLLDGIISQHNTGHTVTTGSGLLYNIEQASNQITYSTASIASGLLSIEGEELTWKSYDYYPANPSQFTLDQEEEEKFKGSIFNLITLTKE